MYWSSFDDDACLALAKWFSQVTKFWKLRHPAVLDLTGESLQVASFLKEIVDWQWSEEKLCSTVFTSYFHWILQEGAPKKILLPLNRYNFSCNLFIFAVQFPSEEKLAYILIFICPWIVNLLHMVVAWLQNQMRSPQKQEQGAMTKTAKVQGKQGELSASDEQTLIRHVQVCTPRSKRRNLHILANKHTASLGIQARLSGSYQTSE